MSDEVSASRNSRCHTHKVPAKGTLRAVGSSGRKSGQIFAISSEAQKIETSKYIM